MIDPSTVVNFGIAVALGRFVSDVAFRAYVQRTEKTPTIEPDSADAEGSA